MTGNRQEREVDISGVDMWVGLGLPGGIIFYVHDSDYYLINES